jgi:hypothetical protein
MSNRTLIVAGFVGLFLLHQDYWWRNDPTLVFGILPVSLAYHVGWSLLVAGGWWLVGRLAWPAEIDQDTSAPKVSREEESR